MNRESASGADALDRFIVFATQEGLPLTPRPYHALADRLGLDADTVMSRLRAMLDKGAIRRIAAVPNHYVIGYRANGMSVWDVEDERVSALGARVAALPFVSHCYRRPRVSGRWRYNLFAMVHGGTRLEVAEELAQIAAVLGNACRAHDVLYSTRILKKSGLRLVGDAAQLGRPVRAARTAPAPGRERERSCSD
jgi:DNA-binding Lrp family transcriptional regulator